MWWNPNTFANDQASEVEYVSGGSWWAISVRNSGSSEATQKCYLLYCDSGVSLRFGMQWLTEAWGVYLDSGTTTVTKGTRYRLVVSGQDTNIQLRAYVDDVLKATLNYADFVVKQIINSGVPGLYANAANPIMDNWEGESIGVGPQPHVLWPRRRVAQRSRRWDW